MKKNFVSKIMMLFLAVSMLLASSACGSKAATAADLPVYPNAVQLKPGEDPIADTLAKNMEQDASIRQSVGVGGKMEQVVYRLPADGTWDAVKAFYDKELKAAGWKSGTGGIAGDIASQVLETANQASDMLKTTMYSKGKQTLTLFRLLETPDATQAYLIISLNSN
jgi:hypothetical protein